MACVLFYSRLPSFHSVRDVPGLFCQGSARSVLSGICPVCTPVPPPPPPPFISFVANKRRIAIRLDGRPSGRSLFSRFFDLELRSIFSDDSIAKFNRQKAPC